MGLQITVPDSIVHAIRLPGDRITFMKLPNNSSSLAAKLSALMRFTNILDGLWS